MPDFTTIEYILPSTTANLKPIFILLVDTAVPSDELAQLKDSLQQSISFIPQDAHVGLITYGKMAFVHELGFSDCPRAYVFRGDKELAPKEIQDQLGIHLGSDPLNKGDSLALKRFLVPV
jgi:protein transport protein SEC23